MILSVVSAVGATAVVLPGSGELDAGFAPVAEELDGRREFIVAGDACYGYDLLIPDIRRYGDDGRWDGTSIVVDDDRPNGVPTIHWVVATPWGGLWAHSSVAVYGWDAQGLRHPLPTPGARVIPDILPFLALDDGGWLTPDLTRFNPEGVRNSAFAFACRLEFGRPNGRRYIQQVLRDGQGRLLAIGNFVRSGEETRLGIVRVLPDGRPDPAFDPAEVLGISVSEEGVLGGVPLSMALGPGGSLYLQTPGTVPNRRLAQLDDGGNLVRWIPLEVEGHLLPPVIQPDGRILLGGQFHRVQGRPATGLARLLADGTLDESFQVELANGPSEVGELGGMELDDRGRLWIHGAFDRVNGIERPGLARVLAHAAPDTAPEIRSTAARSRIATNEVLYLAAEVRGDPPPDLQWTLAGEPIAGATHRVLRLPVEAGTPLGAFRLIARNAAGVQELEFPQVTLAIRSPDAGQLDTGFDVSLGRLPDPQILTPLPNGDLLVSSFWRRVVSEDDNDAMLGRLRADGTWDAAFGQDGVVSGNGFVRAVLPLPDGGVLIGGNFTRMAGVQASGLLELDGGGRPVPRTWPALDIPDVTALARQSDGKLLVAGRFLRIGGRDAYHLARLDSQGQPDPGFCSTLAPGQVVERMQTDSRNRIVIAGFWESPDYPLLKLGTFGLQRLMPDGALDPTFSPDATPWNQFFVLPGDSLLAGLPPQHLDADGSPVAAFDLADLSVPGLSPNSLLDMNMVLLPQGGVIAPALRRSNSHLELVRWRESGVLDDTFRLTFGRRFDNPLEVRSMALMPDGSVVLATMETNRPETESSFRLRRVLPDPDTSFGGARLVGSHLEATVATQHGATYEIYLRSRLDSAARTRVDGFAGDGYVRTISLPLAPDDEHQFLELVRHRGP